MELNTHKKESAPPVEELFKRIQDLQDAHARLKQKMLMISDHQKTSNLVPRQSTLPKLREAQCFNILQSIDEPIHIANANARIIYRNRAWENFFGYTAAETLGKAIFDLVIEPKDAVIAVDILQEIMMGESWSGEFPVRNKRGERFVVFGSNEPFHNENGTIIGVICVSTARQWIASKRHGLDPQQPLQTAIPSKISDLLSDMGNCHKDFEIKWEDLKIREQIGRGSCSTVYRAVWYGSNVALKLFLKQEYSRDFILSLREEVSLMKRLRHPNVLLFMGTVISSQHLCIVTEFLQRGSLFQLLHRNTGRLDWRRRVHMAIDIARGMNYLHHSLPFTIHCNLKSSNLLVDKNWRVKVGGFGLGRIKHEIYLKATKEKRTPEWMVPKLLSNEQTDEKSDVYSYGVVLWEMTTEKIPWDGGNSMQATECVRLMNERKDVDPGWASLIESCLCSEAESRPTFQELLDDLKLLQKKFAIKTTSFS